jgi:phosphotriesterase-related protein
MAMLNTVLGPIDASEIGDTMSHVHLTIDLLCWHMPPESGPQRGLSENRITMRNLGEVRRNAMRVRDNLVQDDLDLAIREATDYRVAGGRTVINCDLPGIGRDVTALRRISRATGINIVASTGWYVQASHPPEIAKKSVEELAEIMVKESPSALERPASRRAISARSRSAVAPASRSSRARRRSCEPRRGPRKRPACP